MGQRKKKLLFNSIWALISEIVAVICSFILPGLILQAFGSKYNGLTSSITQFIAYVALLKSGIGGATRAALYKPLAEGNAEEISSIMNATSAFMRRVAGIFGIGLLLYAALFPFLMKNDFDWLFTFSLVLIIGISTFAQYYFCVAYQMLLMADQREYVNLIINIITTILNTIVAAILIKFGGGIHLVKLGSSLVFLLGPLLTCGYIKKHYSIDKEIKANNEILVQRWDSFAHQLANFVHGNTDIVILTFFSNVLEISVYSVYYLVFRGIRKVVIAISTGIEAAFGNMIANHEENVLKKSFEMFELVSFNVTTFLLTVTALLCVPFVVLYTKRVSDVNYVRHLFCYIAAAGEFFYCIRIPYESVTRAAGHYRQTRNGALIEPIVNIVISLIFVIPMGIVGVAIGTFIAMAFRTIQYMVYVQKKLIKRNFSELIRPFVTAFFSLVVSFAICAAISPSIYEGYTTWVLWACADSCIVIAVILVANMVFNYSRFRESVRYIRILFKHE